MCLWEEKTASLAGIKPSARTDNNNMERKQSPPSYDTVEEPYHGEVIGQTIRVRTFWIE